MTHVYIVWRHEGYGEPPELVKVFRIRLAARKYIQSFIEYGAESYFTLDEVELS